VAGDEVLEGGGEGGGVKAAGKVKDLGVGVEVRRGVQGLCAPDHVLRVGEQRRGGGRGAMGDGR
jgi:hypothetical protein